MRIEPITSTVEALRFEITLTKPEAALLSLMVGQPALDAGVMDGIVTILEANLKNFHDLQLPKIPKDEVISLIGQNGYDAVADYRTS